MGSIKTPNWTSEQDERLAELWKLGMSASQIAYQFHQEKLRSGTRNSIIGRITRLGLGGRKLPSKPYLARTRKPTPAKVLMLPAPLPKRTYIPRVVEAAQPSLQISLLDLQPWQCRAVTAAPTVESYALYCGHTAEAGAYCPAHRAAFYQPANAQPRAR